MKKKNKGYRNKDPRYLEKANFFKKQIKRFFIREAKRKYGVKTEKRDSIILPKYGRVGKLRQKEFREKLTRTLVSNKSNELRQKKDRN